MTQPDGQQRRKPPNRTVGWGRGGSEHRPGLFALAYFQEQGEGCAAGIFAALNENLEILNEERLQIGETKIRKPTYASFLRYLRWFVALRLLEKTGRHEPAKRPFLKDRVYYRLTEAGRRDQVARSEERRV